jgi:alpha-D-ribose 1-methylphosphonate 5-triphosphate synthase subunit PhnG
MAIETRTDDGLERRRIGMEILAKADEADLVDAWSKLSEPPRYQIVRGPETGLVMIRGRIGGGGSPFNLGEASVSRATIRLESGEIGHGHCLGLSKRKAELIALFDALYQRPEHVTAIDALLAGISAVRAEEDRSQEKRTAATRVEFFTMVRGDD